MKQVLHTNFKPCQIKVTVTTDTKTRVYIKASDNQRADTVFTNRYKDILGKEDIIIQMPVSPQNCLVAITDAKGGDNGFKVTTCAIEPLKKRIALSDIKNVAVQEFMMFADRIAYNFNRLETKTYQSNRGNFFITIENKIRDRNGNELNTPARIATATGIITLSKSKLANKTVPYIVALLTHEFSHYYLNENMRNEEEADKNGLLIYLCLGYPRIEAYQAYYDTFKNADTPANQKRWMVLDKMIRTFDNVQTVIR
jgi:hypothetical protein